MKICIEAMNDIDNNNCIPKWLSALCIRLNILKELHRVSTLHFGSQPNHVADCFAKNDVCKIAVC